jgi:CheY-like chemotaxis protein
MIAAPNTNISPTFSATAFKRADGTPRRVLYAEDQTTSRIVTKAMLERLGFAVDAVEDGELAVEHASRDTYDVILLDIEMPVMDGVTAARSIRADLAHCSDTPILALSAFLADSTEVCPWRDAFDQALSKPANSNELLKAMTSAVKFKDGKTAIVPGKPSREDLLDALRGSLPRGVWLRLAETAGKDMFHLVNCIGAALEASDENLILEAVTNLRGLAKNFGATEVVDELNLAIDGARLAAVRQAVANWINS